MPVLFLSEPRCTLRRQADALIVTRRPENGGADEEVLLKVQPDRLELVALVGAVHVTADALHLCFDHGVDLAWFTSSGRLRGRAVAPASCNADLRLCQYARLQEDPTPLALGFAQAKLANAACVLVEVQGNYSDNPLLPAAIAQLKELGQRCTAMSTDSILGIEGAATRTYFEAFGSAFRGELSFAARRRQPPTDPVNSLLSFGYVLLTHQIAGLVEARGMDPALGFLHRPHAGRPSLALDLLEEFRAPVVDRFVLRLANLRIMRPEHFHKAGSFDQDGEPQGACLMTNAGRKIFFNEWAHFLLKPLRAADEPDPLPVGDLLRRQVERLAADFRGSRKYEPFRYRRG